jgi:BASS family bile acid:Na+ symporter
MTRFLSSSAAMMSLSLFCAFLTNYLEIFPEAQLPPSLRSILTVGGLAMMLTLSLSRIPGRNLSPLEQPKALIRGLLMGLLIPAVIPILGYLFLKHTAYATYATGLVFIAATPFAASVAPLSFILRGDLVHAARSTIYVYLVALFWIPLVVYVFLGTLVDIGQLVKIVLVIIGLPLVLSRFLTRVSIPPTGMAILLNVTIFFLVWLSVSTADFRSAGSGIVLFFLLIVVLRTFGLGLVVDALDRKIGVGWGQRVTDILMTSYKNKGMAIALCVSVMGPLVPHAMVAIATSIVMEVCWVIYMDSVLFSRQRMTIALAQEQPAS